MGSGSRLDGRHIAAQIFANEADPAFKRRASWIGEMLSEPHVKRGAKVLDAGCGRGFYFALYARLGHAFSGLEADPALVNGTANSASALGGDFRAGEVEHMPFADAEFDAVIFSEVLEHLKDPQLALCEARRVLRPGGLLLVTVPCEDYPFFWDPINFVLEATIGRPVRSGPFAGIWANHERLYAAGALSAEVEAAGFAVADLFTHTSVCLPFVHNLVYGFGKPLLEGKLLPKAWQTSAARGAGVQAQAMSFDPVRWGISLIQWCDSFNADRAGVTERAQNICLAARRGLD